MGENFQIYRAAVKAARGIRQFQRADGAAEKENFDATVRHLNKGLDDFVSALDHLGQAEDDAYAKASSEINQGNEQLKKSIEAYADGKPDSAASHYEKALDKYDDALDLLDA